MWWTKGHAGDRGGFQNRDVGRSSFNNDFGPDYGVDYARFSDPPDEAKDLKLEENIRANVGTHLPGASQLEVKVRNGFVILTGNLPDGGLKREVVRLIKSLEGVREIISQITITS